MVVGARGSANGLDNGFCSPPPSRLHHCRGSDERSELRSGTSMTSNVKPQISKSVFVSARKSTRVTRGLRRARPRLDAPASPRNRASLRPRNRGRNPRGPCTATRHRGEAPVTARDGLLQVLTRSSQHRSQVLFVAFGPGRPNSPSRLRRDARRATRWELLLGALWRLPDRARAKATRGSHGTLNYTGGPHDQLLSDPRAAESGSVVKRRALAIGR